MSDNAAVPAEVQTPAANSTPNPIPEQSPAPAPEANPNPVPEQSNTPEPVGALDDLFRNAPQNEAPAPEQAPTAEQAQKEGQNQNQIPTPPERYEFKAADGTVLDAVETEAYSGVAKELGLSQEQAQKLFDAAQGRVDQLIQVRQQQALQQMHKAWDNALANDAELGGANLPQTRLNVERFIKRFSTPNFNKLMSNVGLSRHPEFVRVMSRVGSAMGNDSDFVSGNSAASAKPNPLKGRYKNSPDMNFDN